MPLRFHLDVVSAEAQIFAGSATMVVVPGIAGELGILARHAPLLARLKPGQMRMTTDGLPGKEERSFYISGGFIEVQPHVVTVLADTVVRSDAVNARAAQAARERIERALKGEVPRQDYERLKAELRMYTMILRQLQTLRKAGRK